MIKFNFEACKRIDKNFRSNSIKKQVLCLIDEDLVDSNMFIRAILLMCDWLMESGVESQMDFVQNSPLLCIFKEFEKQVNYVRKMVGDLKVDKLTQENVSCLNTSLVSLEIVQ